MEKIYKEGNRIRVKVAPVIWNHILATYPERTVKELKNFKDFEAWTKGEKDPTINQLERFSQKFYIPFHYFFLDKPPEESIPVPFYRKGKKWNGKLSPELRKLLKDFEDIQNFIEDYLKEIGISPLSFIGRLDPEYDIKASAQEIRNFLEIKENWNLEFGSREKVFRFLRNQIEKKGICVFVNSTVWFNSRRKLDPDEFKGFTLISKHAPLIFINSADFLNAQIFTLVHEVVHVLLGKGEILGDGEVLLPGAEEIEIFCNKVTAELLVPEKLFLNRWNKEWKKNKQATFEILAEDFKVSPLVIAIRARNFEFITEEEYQNFYNSYLQQIAQLKLRIKSEKDAGSADFYSRCKKIFSSKFVQYVIDALNNDFISFKEAMDYLNLYGSTFDKFIKGHLLELEPKITDEVSHQSFIQSL